MRTLATSDGAVVLQTLTVCSPCNDASGRGGVVEYECRHNPASAGLPCVDVHGTIATGIKPVIHQVTGADTHVCKHLAWCHLTVYGRTPLHCHIWVRDFA